MKMNKGRCVVVSLAVAVVLVVASAAVLAPACRAQEETSANAAKDVGSDAAGPGEQVDAAAAAAAAGATAQEQGETDAPAGENMEDFEDVDGSGLLVKVVEPGEACTTPLREGDIAHIMYVGMHKGNVIDYAGPDKSGKQRGQVFKVGNKQMLRGVEKALLGYCTGARIRAVIPPHLAFDDPELPIESKPVPDDAHVNYDVALVAYETPSMIRDAQRAVVVLLEQVWPLLLFGAAVGCYMLYRRSRKSSKRVPAPLRQKLKRKAADKKRK